MSTEHQARLRLSLAADGREGLYRLLVAACSATIGGRFQLEELFAAGRQSILFSAIDQRTGRAVLVKQPSFDYTRPLQVSRAEAARARAALRTEYEVLGACTTGHLPGAVALVIAPSPIPAAKDFNVLGREEVFVVEERIAGRTLEQAAMGEWPRMAAEERERLVREIAEEALRFWSTLRRDGYHYGDTSARNLLLEDGTDRVRVVDAACVCPAAEKVVVRECSAAFLTPRLYEAIRQGQPITGSEAGFLPVLAKVLHFALTRRQPTDGTMPDFVVPEMAPYSAECRLVLRTMAEVDGDDGRLGEALAVLREWVR